MTRKSFTPISAFTHKIRKVLRWVAPVTIAFPWSAEWSSNGKEIKLIDMSIKITTKILALPKFRPSPAEKVWETKLKEFSDTVQKFGTKLPLI